jgi:hypothetical protein
MVLPQWHGLGVESVPQQQTHESGRAWVDLAEVVVHARPSSNAPSPAPSETGGLCTCLDPWTTSGAQQWLQRWSRMPGGNSPNGCSPGWLSAADRHSVIHLLTTVPGTDVGGVPPTEPAEAGDERVDALVQGLDGQQWRRWSLARLSADLVGSLEAWRAEREALESDLRRLLDDH